MRPSMDCFRQWNSERSLGASATIGRPSKLLCMRWAWRHVPSNNTTKRGPVPRPGASSPAAEPSSAASSAGAAGTASVLGKRTNTRPAAAATSSWKRATWAVTPCTSTSLPGMMCSTSLPVLDPRGRSFGCIHTMKRTRSPMQLSAVSRARHARSWQMQCSCCSMHFLHLPSSPMSCARRSTHASANILCLSAGGVSATRDRGTRWFCAA
mmetsp:Transcript_101110/g.286581  ORF Transcript_101110/g.286581 Transcript_101110/m.286581 type:complete len:210 (-) Transcript_101110:175-804(-)